jgi:CubicO group peptidase (beta-lactamase class C family)
VTGVRLDDYIQKYICEPLGIKNISMFPHESMKAKLAYMHFRNLDGTLSPNDHINHRPLTVSTKAEKEATLNSGGAGVFANPGDYCRKLVLDMLLSIS